MVYPAAVRLPFSCEKFNGFGKTLAKKLHDKINGAAALALAVAIPLVAPDGQAVVPFPSVFLSGAFQRFPLRLQEQNKVGLVRPVYLFLGVVQKTHSFHRSMSCRFVRVCVCSGWSARSAISTHLRIF